MDQNTTPASAHSVRYSSSDLAEFKVLITGKLDRAYEELRDITDSLLHRSSNDTDDTYSGVGSLEEGNATLEREELAMLAARQQKFVEQLGQALGRIHNGTYGVCRATGELIPKERLRLVPHATLCMAAKEAPEVGRTAA